MCFSQTTGPFSVDAASTGVQSQVMCSPYVLSIYLFSGSVCTYAWNSCVYTHIPIHGMQRSEIQMTQGQAWKAWRYLKMQQNTDVQLIPHTFKKLVPWSLPACSTQATFQGLLLHLSLELQYYWEASGRLVLPYASQAHSGKVFTAQTTAFQTVKMSKLSTLPSLFQHSQEILSSIFNCNCVYLLPAITCLQDFYYPKRRKTY